MTTCALLGGRPHDPAVIVADSHAGRTLTYAGLAIEVTRRSEALFGSDCRPTLVWSYARNDLDSLLTYLAALAAGRPIALVDPDLPEPTRRRLEDAYRPQLTARTCRDQHLHIQHQPADPRPFADDLAVLLLTSGSTGSPKTVRLSSHAVLANADGIGAALRLDRTTRAVTTLPPFYSYGLSVLNSVLRAGGSLVLTEAGLLDAQLWRHVDTYAVTTLAGVPQSYAMLRRLRFLRRIPPTLRSMTAAGGRLPDDVIGEFADALAAQGAELFVMYGQTEATARICVLDPAALPAKVGSVGQPLPGGRITVDPATAEIVYSGPNVMLGYATGRDDLARGDDLGGVLRTGDLGHLDDDGDLWITGRSKRIAKIAGVRLALDDVEQLLVGVLRDQGLAGEAAALAHDERLHLWCAQLPDGARRTVTAELARRLQVPATLLELHPCSVLPRTSSGKIAYAELRTAA